MRIGRLESEVKIWLRRDAWVLVVASILAGVAAVAYGQDANWDLLNYHIYDAWALINHRWSVDCFVAGIQTYFDPALDVPYYILSMGVLRNHPRILEFLTGLPFGFLVYASYLLIREFDARLCISNRYIRYIARVIILCASISGVAAWSQLGTTTNEVTVAAIDLFGFYCLLKYLTKPNASDGRTSVLIFSGVFFGAAAGLKLTAAIYVPAVGLAIIMSSPNLVEGLRRAIICGSGWLLAFVCLYGPWAVHLLHQTGNPFFPMFNEVFQSNLSAPISWRDTRFLPKNLSQWFFYPFFWLSRNSITVSELPFRDARLAWMYVATAAYVVAYFVSGRKLGSEPFDRAFRTGLWFLWGAYATWLILFSILRYAIAIEVLASILGSFFIIRLPMILKMESSDLVKICVLAVFSLSMMLFTRMPARTTVPFSNAVFTTNNVTLKKNALVIFTDQPTGLMATLIKQLNPTAHFEGITSCFRKGAGCYKGFYSYGVGKRLRDEIDSHDGAIYVAYYLNEQPSFEQLTLFGVSVEMKRCKVMSTNVTPDLNICEATRAKGSIQPPTAFHLGLIVRRTTKNFRLTATWKFDACEQRAMANKLTMNWETAPSIRRVTVLSQSPPNPVKIFATGAGNGTATTGLWVQSGQVFHFFYRNNRKLATVFVEDVPCDSEQRVRYVN